MALVLGLPRAQLSLSRGLNAVALPLLAGASAPFDSAALAAFTGARFVVRTRSESGRGVFETYLPGVSPRPFPVEAGHGYLASIAAASLATSFDIYADVNADGVPDNVIGLSGGATADSDGDDLSNGIELRIGTDSDSDGASDGAEVLRSPPSNPFDPASVPPPAPKFTADIWPIFRDRCIGCHDGGNDWPPGY